MHMVLHVSAFPKTLWGEVLVHVTWVKNHIESHVLNGKTLYELLMGKKPVLANLPEWGSYVWVYNNSGPKLNMRVCEGCWVGFDVNSGAHRIYDEDHCMVYAEHNVLFARPQVMTRGPGMRCRLRGSRDHQKKVISDATETMQIHPSSPNALCLPHNPSNHPHTHPQHYLLLHLDLVDRATCVQNCCTCVCYVVVKAHTIDGQENHCYHMVYRP